MWMGATALGRCAIECLPRVWHIKIEVVQLGSIRNGGTMRVPRTQN